MINWLAATPAFISAVALLFLPGLLVGYVLRLRGLWLWATAGPISITVIVVASLTLSFAGLRWGVFGLSAVTVVLTAVVGTIVRVCFKQPSLRVVRNEFPSVQSDQQNARGLFGSITAAALVLGGAVVLWRVTEAIGDPGNISQTFDNIFHLNAVRFVIDTADASPLNIGLMNSPSGNLGFYPSAWHALVSLVVILSGASIPIATSAAVAAIASLVWVGGAVLLARTLLGSSIAVTLSAAALATGFAAFPVLLIYYGVLYPMFLGFSLVPVALSVVLGITRLERDRSNLTLPTRWLLLLGLIPGVAVSHPGALMALLAFSVPPVAVWGWFGVREAKTPGKVWGALALFFAVGVIGLLVIRPPREQAKWENVTDIPGAAVDFLLYALNQGTIPVVLAAAVLLGLCVAVVRHRKADIALLGMYLVAAALYVVAAGVSVWGIRYWVTGVWYQNIPRIEAMTVFAALPLAALGASWLIERITNLVRRNFDASSARGAAANPLTLLITSVLAVLVLVGVQSSGQLENVVDRSWQSYQYTSDSALVSVDELALLNRLDESVPADATVVTNGWTGAGLAYAFADRWVTMPHVMVDFTPDATVLNGSLNSARPGSGVCGSVRAENAQFVLDFGTREVHGGTHDFPGLMNLESSPAVELVDKEGEAKLYRIVGCDSSVQDLDTK